MFTTPTSTIKPRSAYQTSEMTTSYTTFTKATSTIKPESVSEVTTSHTDSTSVITNYTNNIYFSVKTSANNYKDRVKMLMSTWFQTVDRSKLYLVSDNANAATTKVYATEIKQAGFNLIVTNCPYNHTREGLCCKAGIEFASYYKVLEQDKNNEDGYQWYCHFDDDVYVNVPQLSHVLQQYDPHKPFYIGKYPWDLRKAFEKKPYVQISTWTARQIQKMKYPVKSRTYQYATGSGYCLSREIMIKVKSYFNGNNTFTSNCIPFKLPDDMAIGLILGSVLHFPLTNIDTFYNEYDELSKFTKEKMLKSITIGYYLRDNKTNTVPLESCFPKDTTKFMAYHCLLYPKVLWCQTNCTEISISLA
ncbi:beta-1,3-N-acetylglucosaminyltransferase lunatic fringe-like isoform X2 [Dysidea avara]